jgi:hypothetical protein
MDLVDSQRHERKMRRWAFDEAPLQRGLFLLTVTEISSVGQTTGKCTRR